MESKRKNKLFNSCGHIFCKACFYSRLTHLKIEESSEKSIKCPINNKKFEFFSRNYYTNFNLEVYSYDGKLMKDERIIINEGKNEIDFNYPKGNYILVLKNDDYKKTIKIIVN